MSSGVQLSSSYEVERRYWGPVAGSGPGGLSSARGGSHVSEEETEEPVRGSLPTVQGVPGPADNGVSCSLCVSSHQTSQLFLAWPFKELSVLFEKPKFFGDPFN